MTLTEEWSRAGLTPKMLLLDFDLRRIAALIAVLSFGIDPLPEGKVAN